MTAAPARLNTLQQVGGSIGTAALSTVALTAGARALAARHAGPLAPAVAAVHGYTVAFATSAALFGAGAVLAVVLLPSRERLRELRAQAAAVSPAPAEGTDPALRSLSPGTVGGDE